MSKNYIITQLEERVQSTIQLIQELKQENKKLSKDYSLLKEKLTGYESKISQLEELVSIAEREHKNLEKSVISVLSNFDDVEEIREVQTKNTKSVKSSDTTDSTKSKNVEQIKETNSEHVLHVDKLAASDESYTEKVTDLEIF